MTNITPINQARFELLLPVGNRDMALAAIHNGADAIYIGTPKFNARGRSYDFEIHELKEIIELCHLYGVKVHLALNIVIFENEFDDIFQLLKVILPLKPDSFIVQDLGLIQLIKKLNPRQNIHASTQMTITNDLAIALLDDLNIKRFVLGRENSIPEIKLIKNNTSKELEVFVHGALCVSYSGQCFTSETLGGRSANRGQCAQSCRFSYDLIVDDQIYNTKNRNYLVSPKDLCGINEIPQLMEIGVDSFKVEGRLKSPEYVASVARSYREKIDNYLLNNSENKKNKDNDFCNNENDNKFLLSSKYKLQKAKPNSIESMQIQYSRGFFTGWLQGVNHQKLVDGNFSSHRGLPVGKIIAVTPHNSELTLELTTSFELKNGDGILWAQPQETGSFIFSVEYLSSKKVTLGIAKQVQLSRDMIGSTVFVNHDKDLKSELQKSFTHKDNFKKILINFEITIKENNPLEVTICDGLNKVTKLSSELLQKAQNKPLSEEFLIEEFSSLGGTVFTVLNDNNESSFKFINNSKGINLFIPHKSLKQLRQSLTEELTSLRKNNLNSHFNLNLPSLPLDLNNVFKDIRNDLLTNELSKQSLKNDESNNFNEIYIDNEKGIKNVHFHILVRDKSQVLDLANAINLGKLIPEKISSIILDFEFGRDYKESLDIIRKYKINCGIATTRILKPQEYNNLKIISNLNPDIILVRNLGALYYYTNIQETQAQLKGDFSLNVTNHLSAEYLLSKGLFSVCASYDLNQQQMSELFENTNAKDKLEITIHQSVPSFHMEHCVFAAFLSDGTSFRDCGKPCEKHQVKLKDQFGNWHLIKPDQECRNTMFNAKSQTAARFINDWIQQGLRHLRFEALYEKGDELISKLQNYLELIANPNLYEKIAPQLATLEKYGLDDGSLIRQHQYQPRKKSNSVHIDSNNNKR